MAFVIWFLLNLNLVLAAGMRYAVIGNWTLSSKNWTIANPDNYRCRSLTNGTSNVVSDNGIFALAYCEEDTSEEHRHQHPIYNANTYTAMIIMLRNTSRVSVWIADWNSGLYFEYGQDQLGKVVELSDTGNLFYGSEMSRQSFKEPLSILLPGQLLHAGMKIQSYNSLGRSVFGLHAIEGGLVLNISGSDYLGDQLYQVWSLKSRGKSTSYSSASTSECAGYSAVLEYTGMNLTLKYEQLYQNASTGSCEVPPIVLPLNGSLPEELPFLRLEDNGDLVTYRYSQQDNDWIVHSRLSDRWKGFFSHRPSCGPYGLGDESNEGHCICLITDKLEPCSSDNYTSDRFSHGLERTVKLNGVGYFGTEFTQARNTPTIENCSELCPANGSCYAAFYNRKTLECFTFDDPLVASLYWDNNMTAILHFYHEPQQRLLGFYAVYSSMLVVPFAFILAIIGLAYYNNKLKDDEGQQVEALLSTMQGLPQRYTYTALDAATKGFATKLGVGGFGSVYEGFTSDNKHVAVKKLNDNGSQGAKQFVTEVAGMGGISHVNVLKLCGFCIEGATQKLLVYEFMPNGSLDRWLFGDSSSSALDWELRIAIALGTARGLSYLHEECSEPILHFDVKPQNILLDDKFVPKVADFGMAKLLENRDVTQVHTSVRGTPGYLAPEWSLHNIATKKCDVYSYGMVLLELIGGRKNIDTSKLNDEDELLWYFPAWAADRVKKKKLIEVVDTEVRDVAAREEHSAERMVHLALWCIQDNPSRRPTMSQIVEIIEREAIVEEPPMAFQFDVQDESITSGFPSRLATMSSFSNTGAP